MILGILALVSLATATYTENLSLSSDPNGNIKTLFTFSNSATFSTDSPFHNFDNFPPSIYEVMKSDGVFKINVFLTRGRAAVRNVDPILSKFNPPGLHIEIWMRKDNADIWDLVSNTLSGILCSSINLLQHASLLRPIGHSNQHCPTADCEFRRAFLPHESLCTENITPWLELLPCSSNAGLSKFLDPHRVLSAQFLTLKLSLVKTCIDLKSCSQFQLSMQQSIDIIWPMKYPGSLESIFKRRMRRLCSASQKTTISTQDSVLELNATNINTFDQVAFPPSANSQKEQNTDINVHLLERGQESGIIHIEVDSTKEQTLEIPIPKFILPYFHTVRVESCVKTTHSIPSPIMYFKNPSNTSSGSLFVRTPANFKCVTIMLEFEKGLLHYSEYPPDANKGFDMGPITILSEETLFLGGKTSSIASPDFSMPYNVITLTCTAIALMFGSLINSLIRDMQCLKISK